MVPVKCGNCKTIVMIWDTHRVSYSGDKAEFFAYVCDKCIESMDFRSRPHQPETKKPLAQPFTAPEPGSGNRYKQRRTKTPWFQHTFWWLVHNCISHPLIGVIPTKTLFRFHDWTSYKMHGLK